jgi:predicted transcriptional regulator
MHDNDAIAAINEELREIFDEARARTIDFFKSKGATADELQRELEHLESELARVQAAGERFIDDCVHRDGAALH